MDSIFAVIGNVGLQDKAEVFLNSCFKNGFTAGNTLSIPLAAHQTHFAYLTNYSRSPTNDYIVEPQEHTAVSACPVLAISRIDNRKELELSLPEPQASNNQAAEYAEDPSLHTPHPLTDEQLLLQLYKHHGEYFCARVQGTFCYILWDEATQQVHAAIEPFNSRSLFYMQLDGLLYIASDASLLASHPQVSVTANKRALAQWLKGQPDPFVSMFNEISMLPGGHRLVFSPDTKITVSKFWDINPDLEIRYKDPAQYAAHFFNLLYTSVKTRMQSNSTAIFSQMSGGMDSTSITAIANMIAPDNGQQLCLKFVQ